MGFPLMCSAISWKWYQGCHLRNSSKPVFLKPLGMVDTAFSVPPEKVDRFAALYRHNRREGQMKTGSVEMRPLQTMKSVFSHRAVEVWSQPLRITCGFLRCCSTGGELDGVRILGKKTVELMRYPHHDDWFGLGFRVVTRKNPPNILNSVGNFSWGGCRRYHFLDRP